MGKINLQRVIAGGLVSALVIAVFGTVVTPFFPETWTTAMAALGSEFSDPTATWPLPAILAGLAVQLGTGIVIVWTYAAIRPRFGPGPRTAALAGLLVWLIIGIQILSLVVLRSISFQTFLVLHGPYVVALVLASLAGAWLYREGGTRPESPALAR